MVENFLCFVSKLQKVKLCQNNLQNIPIVMRQAKQVEERCHFQAYSVRLIIFWSFL